ncbi:MAG: RlmE family RNA methyltransferase [Thermodesulfobacteriota bacterium]
MKEVQDYYFKKAKKEGYPARSVYKLEEAQLKHRLLKRGDRVLDLGCQPGSWTMYAAAVVGPEGLVVGVDLNFGQIRTKGKSAPVHFLHGDIMTDAVLERVREICPSCDVLLSDMAPRTTGNKWADQQQSLALSRRVLEIALAMLAPGGNLYCKVFEGEDFKEFVDEVRRHFSATKIVKPKSSRPESREVFVLGMGLHGTGIVSTPAG